MPQRTFRGVPAHGRWSRPQAPSPPAGSRVPRKRRGSGQGLSGAGYQRTARPRSKHRCRVAAIPVAAGLRAHKPHRRLRLAQQCQERRWEVQAVAPAAIGLACFLFRFLRRAHVLPAQRPSRTLLVRNTPVGAGLVALAHLHRGIGSRWLSYRLSPGGIEFAKLLILPTDPPWPWPASPKSALVPRGVAWCGCGIAADPSP